MQAQNYEYYDWTPMIDRLRARGLNLYAWCKQYNFKYKTAYGLATGMRPPCGLGATSRAIAGQALKDGLIDIFEEAA